MTFSCNLLLPRVLTLTEYDNTARILQVRNLSSFDLLTVWYVTAQVQVLSLLVLAE